MNPGTKVNDDGKTSTLLEKVVIGLIIAILIAASVLNFFKIERSLERNRSRYDSHLVSRIIECEHQIALLKDRMEDTRKDGE